MKGLFEGREVRAWKRRDARAERQLESNGSNRGMFSTSSHEQHKGRGRQAIALQLPRTRAARITQEKTVCLPKY